MPKVSELSARQVNDSRGEATIEVNLTLDDGNHGFATVPQGKSTGSHEAVSVPPAQAVGSTPEILAVIKNTEFDQFTLEQKLRNLDGTANKSNLGANTILGISVAFARAVASSQGLQLWEYLRQFYSGKLGEKAPRLYMNMIEGGLHAANNLRIQEYLVIPKQNSVTVALKSGKLFYKSLLQRFASAPIGDEGGFAPQFADDSEPLQALSEVAPAAEGTFEFGIDAAGSNIRTDSHQLYQLYQEIARRFDLSYLEDPFGEESFELFANLRTYFGPRPVIIGDDLTTTNLEQMRHAQQAGSIGGIIIKPNQIGTLGETLQAIKQAREWGWAVIVSHRSGETMDDFIADIAWAVMADGAKFGAPAPPERMVKYQRLAAIESGKDKPEP